MGSPGGGADAGGSGGESGDDKRRKRRKTGPGSRGVATLTPEQLAKKRANDREAQRAIRERTRRQIESLERRVHELTSLKPYQELQAVVGAKEAAESENAEIKRRLAAVVGILKPIIGADSAEGPYASPAQTSAAPGAPAHTPTSAASPAADTELSCGDAGDAVTTRLLLQRRRLRDGLDMGSERLDLGFLLRPGQQVGRIQSGPLGAQDSPQYRHVPMKHDWLAVTEGPSPRAQPGPAQPSPLSPATRDGFGCSLPAAADDAEPPAAAAGPVPRHALLVKNCGPTCPLDSLLLDFLSERRQRAAEGLPMRHVIGPRYPSVSSLLNPANSVHSHPLSKVFTDVLATFPDIATLPERVAVLYVMFLVSRWLVSPTCDNYERLPCWMLPSAAQLQRPHPPWMDFVPFPRMRDRLVRQFNPAECLFDDFFIPYTTTLRVGWPYDDTDTLLLVPGSDDVVINPVFERHLRNIDNWTLGDRFARAFPGLADTFRVK